ncbi:hypothetical protein H8356DRAFT_1636674, partial [Neocallimastix lanati (nom. inval.)]
MSLVNGVLKIMNGVVYTVLKVPTLTPTINTETYYLYNSASNNCIHSSGILDSPIILAYC